MPSLSLIAKRFGSLTSAWRRVGHNLEERTKNGAENVRNMNAVKTQIIQRILSLFPKQITVSQCYRFSSRAELHVHNGLSILVQVPRLNRNILDAASWIIRTRTDEIDKPALICRRVLTPTESNSFYFLRQAFKAITSEGAITSGGHRAKNSMIFQNCFRLPIGLLSSCLNFFAGVIRQSVQLLLIYDVLDIR